MCHKILYVLQCKSKASDMWTCFCFTCFSKHGGYTPELQHCWEFSFIFTTDYLSRWPDLICLVSSLKPESKFHWFTSGIVKRWEVVLRNTEVPIRTQNRCDRCLAKTNMLIHFPFYLQYIHIDVKVYGLPFLVDF